MTFEGLLAPLRVLLRHPRLEAMAGFVVNAAGLLSVFYAVSVYLKLLVLPIYGHDESHYHEFYRFALTDDGRWLNYLLHGYLRLVALPVWAALFVALSWALLYRLARGAFDVGLAALVASTALIASPFVEISLWPATFVPAVTVMGMALWMNARGVSYPVIYIVTGVLVFGTIQTLYFLLPLVFLPQFLDVGQPARARWLLLLKHMLWWVAGSVAGVLVACLMLWLLLGIYFPQPAPWRNTQPIDGWSGFVRNLVYVVDYFFILLKQLMKNGGVLNWTAILLMAAVVLLRVRPLIRLAPALALLTAVGISFFVFNLPLAPFIHMRSLVAMVAALVIGVVLVAGPSPVGRIFAAGLLMKLTLNYALIGRDYLEVQRAETAAFMRILEDLFPGYPMGFAALALDGTMDPARPEALRFNDTSLMHPMLFSLGESNILDCRIPGRCDGVDLEGTPIYARPFAGGELALSVNSANIGIIRYRALPPAPAQ